MFEIEKELLKAGKKIVIGIDEVGRGPLAGDVVAAAVCVDLSDLDHFVEGIKDSKKLSEKKREELTKEIKENALAISIAGASNKVIDQINIRQATLRSMENALEHILEDLKKKGIEADIVLVDSEKIKSPIESMSIIKGDEKCYSIGCASIIAKVYRDNLSKKWDQEYPGYDLKKHKGYATKAHREALVRLGPSPIHRMSFLKNLKKWKDDSYQKGRLGEEMAADYLEKKGHRVLEHNYKEYYGEIDIVSAIDGILVFTEVKLRQNNKYGHGHEYVNQSKQEKIKHAAQTYIIEKKLEEFQPRFDIIEIYTDSDQIVHYENCF